MEGRPNHRILRLLKSNHILKTNIELGLKEQPIMNTKTVKERTIS